MSRQNPIRDLRAAIARQLGESLAAFATAFASLGLPGRWRSAEPGGSPVPAALVADDAESRPAGACPAASQESAFADPSPSVANPLPPAPPGLAAPLAAAVLPAPAFFALVAAPAVAPHSLKVPPAAMPPDPAAFPAVPAPLPADAAPRRPLPAPAADPELEAVRARVASMEARVVDLETRKAEMEQLLAEYALCQYRALGELLDEHLRLRHEVLRLAAERSSRPEDRQAADAAGEEHAAYRRARAEPAAPPAALAEGEGKELTALYRAAAMRCHPDRVGEAAKERAHAMFLRTQDAYRRRDLEALRQISRQLAAGDLPSPADDESTPRERLEALLESLVDKGVELLLAIQSMQMQEAYRRARCRERWQDYFAAARESLEDECAALRRRLSRC